MEVRKFSNAVPWGSIVLFAATMFLARVVGKYKALDLVAMGIFEAFSLGSLTPLMFVVSVVFVAMMLHIIFTSTTVYARAVILPVNTIPNIIFYTEGWFTEQQMISYGLVLSIVSIIVVLSVGIPYWQIIGLI